MTSVSNAATMDRGERLLRIGDVEAKTGLSRASIYRFVRANQFPAQVRLGSGTVRWKETEVDDWIAALPTSGSA